MIFLFFVTKLKQHINYIPIKIFGPTSHLGDSGTKNNPISCTRHGPVRENKTNFIVLKLTPFRPKRSAILPLTNPPITPPIVNDEPKTEYCTRQKKCKINDRVDWQQNEFHWNKEMCHFITVKFSTKKKFGHTYNSSKM